MLSIFAYVVLDLLSCSPLYLARNWNLVSEQHRLLGWSLFAVGSLIVLVATCPCSRRKPFLGVCRSVSLSFLTLWLFAIKNSL